MNNSSVIRNCSYLFMVVFIIGAFHLHLMSSVVAGFTAYLIITHFYQSIAPRMKTDLAQKITLLSLITLVIGLLLAIYFGVYGAIKIGNGSFQNIGNDAFNILQQLRSYLPASLVAYIPEDVVIAKERIAGMLATSSAQIFTITGSSLKALVHVIIGLFLGSIIAFTYLSHNESKTVYHGELRNELVRRVTIFKDVFKKVVFAQVKISAINTILTGIYLIIILPLCGVPIPYAKTLVLLTFLFGLIPVLGNLITNTLIFLISLTVSFKVAIASIVFLIVIHKLEYYINAKIVGEQIKTSIWELLIAMLIMETLFGMLGVVLAPVIYGYIKEELKLKGLI